MRPAEIAERIKHFKKLRGMTGRGLAAACGVTPGAVSEWEAGYTEPTHENLARVVRAFGLEISEFWSAPVEVKRKRRRRAKAAV